MSGAARALALAILTAACAQDSAPGKIGLVEGFAGVVAADEPRAAVTGGARLGHAAPAIDAAGVM